MTFEGDWRDPRHAIALLGESVGCVHKATWPAYCTPKLIADERAPLETRSATQVTVATMPTSPPSSVRWDRF